MSGKTADPEWPNWVELPRDVTAAIFSKLGVIEVLTSVQYVCSSWLKICKDPSMWRTIDMYKVGGLFDTEFDLEKICRSAVDRSNGHLSSINIEYFGNDEILQYIADRSSHLTNLGLANCYSISDQGLIDSVAKFPLLEEVDLSYCSLSKESLEAVGRSCPLLKSLKLNSLGYSPLIECDDDALAIAENMHELRHLQIVGNKLTNSGLETILNGCPHLKSLDLRHCFNINLAGNLKKRCLEKIQDLWCPNDPISDYEFDATLQDGYSFGSNGDDDSFGMYDIEFMSDDDEDNEFSDPHFDEYDQDDHVFSDDDYR